MDCGNPRSIAENLIPNQSTYLGKGYTAYKTINESAIEGYCNHPNKYLNRITTAFQFMVCPDCKKEIDV
jgi:hypothetical protein